MWNRADAAVLRSRPMRQRTANICAERATTYPFPCMSMITSLFSALTGGGSQLSDPSEAARKVKEGMAVLVDVREADERARHHPLLRQDAAPVHVRDGQQEAGALTAPRGASGGEEREPEEAPTAGCCARGRAGGRQDGAAP